VEKPDRATAEAYLASGEYAWNSGMFLASAERLIEEMLRLAPAAAAACRESLAAAVADLDFLRLDAEAFARAPAESLDYAVMEKTDRAAVVPVDIGWTDVGSWDALWQVGETDGDGNALDGDVVALDSRGSCLRSEGPLLAALGVEDLIVVVTADAVLVCPRTRAQDVGELVARLKADGRSEPQVHARVYRPWGSYQGIDAGPGFQAKRLIVNPGASISLQRHQRRAEHWVVVQGTAEVTRDEEVFTLEANQSTYIPLGAKHRLRNPGAEPLHIVEVQSGDYLGEDDIERFEDLYGRD
jgi:mannose-1-phosphate guanylyltransferase/mannose-6-phosphate isomerase